MDSQPVPSPHSSSSNHAQHVPRAPQPETHMPPPAFTPSRLTLSQALQALNTLHVFLQDSHATQQHVVLASHGPGPEGARRFWDSQKHPLALGTSEQYAAIQDLRHRVTYLLQCAPATPPLSASPPTHGQTAFSNQSSSPYHLSRPSGPSPSQQISPSQSSPMQSIPNPSTHELPFSSSSAPRLRSASLDCGNLMLSNSSAVDADLDLEYDSHLAAYGRDLGPAHQRIRSSGPAFNTSTNQTTSSTSMVPPPPPLNSSKELDLSSNSLHQPMSAPYQSSSLESYPIEDISMPFQPSPVHPHTWKSEGQQHSSGDEYHHSLTESLAF